MGLRETVGSLAEYSGLVGTMTALFNDVVGCAYHVGGNNAAYEKCFETNGMIMLAAVPFYLIGRAINSCERD